MHKLASISLFVAGLVAGALATPLLQAQTSGIERSMLLTRPIAASAAYEATVARATIAPGIAAARHFHHGDEIGVLLEGEAEVDIEGQGIVKVKAGEAYHIPAGIKHTPKSTGSVPAKFVAIWVVEKGKPLAVNVP
jgi:mannose-6-phosphate isomerase-like protein (cupin superfamily)